MNDDAEDNKRVRLHLTEATTARVLRYASENDIMFVSDAVERLLDSALDEYEDALDEDEDEKEG
jgi:hypothetical protein